MGESMARRRGLMDDLLDEAHSLFLMAPWWVGLLMAGVFYVGIRFVVPLLVPEGKGPLDAGRFWRDVAPMLATMVAGGILLAWVMAEVRKFGRRRRLEGLHSIESLRAMSWREFEELVGEAYRRKGFVVDVCGSACGDGGVDVRLHRGGEVVLVQCKHWKKWKVGEQIVRELAGVVAAERATRGIVVTSGVFTAGARRFGKKGEIELLDGSALLKLVRDVQVSGRVAAAEVRARADGKRDDVVPTCRCGSPMVIRVARRGANAGGRFWGCSRYPACREVIDLGS